MKLKDHAGVLFFWGFTFQLSNNPEEGEWRSRICTPVSNLLHQTTPDFHTVSGSVLHALVTSRPWFSFGLVTVQTQLSALILNVLVAPCCALRQDVESPAHRRHKGGSWLLNCVHLIQNKIINLMLCTCGIHCEWFVMMVKSRRCFLPSQSCRTARVQLIFWFSSTLTFEKVSSVYFKFIISYLHKTQREVW